MADDKSTTHTSPPPDPPQASPDDEPRYGGFTRFEIELEFVTLLSSPPYLSYLATSKLLQNPEFVAYLNYLLYWTKPPYLQYLSYPGPTLKALELLQKEDFRKDILSPEVVGRLAEAMLVGAVRG